MKIKIRGNRENPLDGGGSYLKNEITPYVKHYIGKVDTTCEVFAGLADIGFDLLKKSITSRLVTIDCYREAVEAVRGRYGTFTFIEARQGDVFDDKDDRFDLIVGNPPHYNVKQWNEHENRRRYDREWKAHERFYSMVDRRLKPGGHVVLIESKTGSHYSLWEGMIPKGYYMRISECKNPLFYIVHIRRRNNDLP